MVQRYLPTLAATFLAASVVLGSAVAMSQTTPPTGPTVTSTDPAPNGPYESLSPGNQKIVRALYQAQRTDLPGKPPLTLDQIAREKHHTGWGEVFKSMKAQGLIEAKNLGQVVSRYHHQHYSGVTTAANRPENAHGTTPGHGNDRDPDDPTNSGHANGMTQTHVDGNLAHSGATGGHGVGAGVGRGR